jgi:DNA polymerase I-like protein with 3'-5' exonuclease and polymerase domains
MISRYKILKSRKQVMQLIRACKRTKYACFDFETSGEPLYSSGFYPTIISVSFQVGSSLIIPLNHFDSPFRDKTLGGNGEWLDILKLFGRKVIENKNITKVAWNWKFDNQIMMKYGIYHKGRAIDGMLAKYLLDEERPMGLKEMVDRYLPEMSGYEDYEGSKLPWDKKPLMGLSKYGGKDTDATLRLSLFFEKKLIDLGFYSLYRNLIMMASKVLQDAEKGGMKLDIEFNNQLIEKYSKLIKEAEDKLMSIPKVAKFSKKLIKQRKQDFIESVEAEIMEIRAESKREKDIRKLNAIEKKIASRQDKIIRVSTNQPQTKAEKAIFEPINLGSQQQMSSLLYLSPFGFKFPIIKYTKDKYNKDTTNPSTAEETIIELIKYDKHGFIKQLLELRKLVTINSTFVLGIREKLGADGKIHPTFNIHGTVTGRMCIASNSLIHTSRGLLRIGDIIPKQPGIIELQEVYMALTHNKQYQKITHAINKGEEEMFKVTLDNGKSIQCTKSHMFLTDRGWMKLKDITNENIICWSDDNNKY